MSKKHEALSSKKKGKSGKKQQGVSEITPLQRSEFAYKPTPCDGVVAESPFGQRSYKHMKGLLMQRVSPSRYMHSLSVAKTARKLARAYGFDEQVARMAGLLHDWDKALKPDKLAARVQHYHLSVDPAWAESMPWLLHGPTAAAVLADEFPCFGSEVFQAIERHTVGACDMSTLDMIVFVADKIEPLHEVPEYERLYKCIGKIPLEDMFFAVLQEGLIHLVRSKRPLCNDSMAVWNWYCAARTENKKGE